jgi:hypothetical protein
MRRRRLRLAVDPSPVEGLLDPLEDIERVFVFPFGFPHHQSCADRPQDVESVEPNCQVFGE